VALRKLLELNTEKQINYDYALFCLLLHLFIGAFFSTKLMDVASYGRTNVNERYESLWEEAVVAYCKKVSRNSPGGTTKETRKHLCGNSLFARNREPRLSVSATSVISFVNNTSHDFMQPANNTSVYKN
jgi:hypothetical protein